MNDVFFHDDNSLKKNVIKYIICLIPLYCYGIYKNGIVLYMKGLISFFSIFKLLLFLFGGLIIYVITNIILKKKINFDLLFLSLFVIPLFLPFNTNIFLYLIVMFIFLLFRKYYNLALIILIFSSFGNFVNLGESLGIYSFNVWDLLCGRNRSGLGSSSIILGFIIMFFLNFTNNYKLSISLSGLIIFFILAIIFREYSFLVNGNAILSLIFIAPWSNLSPMERNTKIIYGFIIGILGFIFMCFFNVYYGMILSISIISVIYQLNLKFKFLKKIS